MLNVLKEGRKNKNERIIQIKKKAGQQTIPAFAWLSLDTLLRQYKLPADRLSVKIQLVEIDAAGKS